jgi:hypothetical protein
MYPSPYPQQPYPPPNPYLDQINQYLMYHLKFTPQELAMNRAGVMSDAQKARFADYMRQQSAAILRIAGVVLLAFIGGLIFFFLRGGGLREAINEMIDSDMRWILIIPVGAILLWGAMIVFGAVRARRAGSGEQRLNIVRGAAKVKTIDTYRESALVLSLAGQPTRFFRVRIGKTDFYVDEAAAQGFVDKQQYIVYGLGSKRGGIVISAEAV